VSLSKVNERFAWFSTVAGTLAGHSLAFIVSLLIVLVWLVTGPLFDFSDTWQLVINTGTTVVTYLLLFLVQNTQNRNAAAMHVKLDELLRADPVARTDLALANLENASDDVLNQAKAELERRARLGIRSTS
jgi:low affinity Fe/Cu permease